MKLYLTLILGGILLAGGSCRKNQAPVNSEDQTLIERSRNYFTTVMSQVGPVASPNPRISGPKTVLWGQAKVLTLSMGKAVSVPIKYDDDLFIRTTQGGQNNFHLNNLAQLLVYQSKGVYHAEVVTGFPDTNYLRRPGGAFSGMVYVEDWAGKDLGKYLYEGGKMYQSSPGKAASPSQNPVQRLNVVTIEVCYQITGYNYSTASPDGGYAWAEAPVCRPSMVPVDDAGIPTDYGNVVSSNGGGSYALNLSIYPGKRTIGNIIDYAKCFTYSGAKDHTYSVTVCVEQPGPGTRAPWMFTASGAAGSSSIGSTPADVGHTFLIFKEVYGTTTIVRNVGFYPTSLVVPLNGSSSSQAQLVDDEEHAYNISGSFTVNSDQFRNVLDYVELGNNKGFAYDINNNNCTTFVINAMKLGNIYLPSTIGVWLNGQGNNPGDLGEDLRQNNIPGMTLSTTELSHPNLGNCDLSATPTPTPI